MDKRKEYASMYGKFDRKLPRVCANCGSDADLQIHHIVPLSYGGNNVFTNLVRLCAECHSKAHGGISFVETSKQKIRDNATKGRRVSGSLTLGYRSKNGVISVNEDEAEIVRLIFSLRYEFECSLTDIPKVLNGMAIPTKRGGDGWKHNQIMKILKNPMYFGEYMYDGVSYGNLITPILDDEMRDLVSNFELKYANKRMSPKQNVFIDGEAI